MADRQLRPQAKNGAATLRKHNGELYDFLRYSHIFASLVREILEEKILNEVSPATLSPSSSPRPT